MFRVLKNVRNLSTAAMTQTELSLPVPWGEIRGKIWGPDDGRPVLCLHGWADNCGTFNTLIPLLPKECQYVAVDLAGHGQSSHRPPGVFYAFSSYVADIRRVVDALRWSRFSILGHSMGGNIAGMKELSTVMRKGMEDMLQFEKNPEKSERVYTYEKAVERLLAANPMLSEASVCTLLERGLVQVEGGFVFSRDFRINLKNIARISLEQSLELQSKIQASVLVVLADEGFEKIFAEADQKKYTSVLLQGFRYQNHSVVTVHGGHHVHLNNPEVVAPLVSEFLHNKVLSSPVRADELSPKL
ncbi:serine hydrolase-like protein isoform X2 [Dunckerocampus dactyliophorus]|uniref:serine hydrolase-like protein isoform X2 n=1 Tax=Dunckerocampus dactyliophorus TaxID=161453 RepID=UPI002406A355|nr:serine hydrolase-like protein isoform X2 [Dunckerocampus dactyliophorus]